MYHLHIDHAPGRPASLGIVGLWGRAGSSLQLSLLTCFSRNKRCPSFPLAPKPKVSRFTDGLFWVPLSNITFLQTNMSEIIPSKGGFSPMRDCETALLVCFQTMRSLVMSLQKWHFLCNHLKRGTLSLKRCDIVSMLIMWHTKFRYGISGSEFDIWWISKRLQLVRQADFMCWPPVLKGLLPRVFTIVVANTLCTRPYQQFPYVTTMIIIMIINNKEREKKNRRLIFPQNEITGETWSNTKSEPLTFPRA